MRRAAINDTEILCPRRTLVVLRTETPKKNGGAPQKNLSLVIGEWLFVIFCLGGPDRRTENAGKLMIFLDEVLNLCGLGHPNFQNSKKNDKSQITNDQFFVLPLTPDTKLRNDK